MKQLVILACALLLMVGCDTMTNLDSAESNLSGPIGAYGSTTSGSHTVTLLPDGVFESSQYAGNLLIIDDGGSVYGSILTDGATMEQAARWSVDASGVVAGPYLLGALPAPHDGADQRVRGSNANGVVVGYAQDYRGGPTVGWVWTDGVIATLPEPASATEDVVPYAVNDAGVTVGQVQFLVGGVLEIHPVVWLPPYSSAPVLLPRPDGYDPSDLVGARAISSDGVVTGQARKFGEAADALVRWQIDGGGNVLSGPDLVQGGDGLLMADANDDLDVVGLAPSSDPDAAEATFLLDDLSRQVGLGALAGHGWSAAYGVTERFSGGAVDVVGQSAPTSSDSHHAVLWNVDASGTVAGPVDLGLPDPYPNNSPSNRFFAAGAHSVNSNGWVVGWSQRADGTYFGALWQPAEDGGTDPPPGDGPSASFTYDCGSSPTCQFTDTSSGGATAWAWTFGDGATSSVQHPAHTYEVAGTYIVTLEVTDASSVSSTASATLDCSSHPRHGLRCR